MVAVGIPMELFAAFLQLLVTSERTCKTADFAGCVGDPPCKFALTLGQLIQLRQSVDQVKAAGQACALELLETALNALKETK